MPQRENPFSYDVLGEIRLGKDPTAEIAYVGAMVNGILKSDKDRSGVLENWKELTKLRYGIRKEKTFPWKNASNLSIPLIDSAIRKYKPALARLFVEADPIVEFVGEDPEAVIQERLAELTYNWLFKTEMDTLEPLAYLLDIMSHKGQAYAQVNWDYQSEYEVRVIPVQQVFKGKIPQDPNEIVRILTQEYDLNPLEPATARGLMETIRGIMSGRPFVKIAYRTVSVDRPSLVERDPVQIILPPRCANYRQAENLTVQHVVSMRTIQRMENDKLLQPGSVQRIGRFLAYRNAEAYNKITGDISTSRSLEHEKRVADERERIWGLEDEDNILLYENYHWYDFNEDGLPERVVSYIHPSSRTKLCTHAYAFNFRRWPFVKFDFEKTTRRVYSPRGISGLIRDMQRELNHQHNSRLDNMTLRNAPVYQVPSLAGFKAKNFRCIPGTVLQMPGGAQITPIMQDRSSVPEQVQEEQLLRGIAEGYVGIFDMTLTNPQAMSKARTATEINAAMQYSAATATLDAILFQSHMKELHTMIWQLYMDLGPEEVYIRVPGMDPNSNEPVLTPLKKSEINRKFRLMPTGTISNTNRALELANMREAIQIFLNDPSGFINPFELRKAYLDLLDYRRSRKLLNTRAQATNLQTLNAAAQAIQDPEVQSALGMGPSAPGGPPAPSEELQAPQQEQPEVSQ